MIRKVKWNNYKSLGSLELDFVNPTSGTPYNTIVLAGENGAGKTTILDSLAIFLNRQSIAPFDYIEYTADGKTFCVSPESGNEWRKNVDFHKRRELGSVSFPIIRTVHN